MNFLNYFYKLASLTNNTTYAKLEIPNVKFT